MSDTGWFGKMGVAHLARQQQATGGITATLRTMIAAYKQFDDIEVLLQLMKNFEEQKGDVPDDVAMQFAKIVERHEKYRVAHAEEALPQP